MTGLLTLRGKDSGSKPNQRTSNRNPKRKKALANREQSKQDSESNDSYNWENIENNPTPDIIDIAYYTA